MGLLSTMVMSMLLRRLDVPVTVWRTPSAVTSPARILRTSMLELRRPVLSSWASFVCGETGDNDRASQGRGAIPVASSPRIWKPRALGGRRGASALGATIALRHDDASPHKCGGGPARQRGLRERDQRAGVLWSALGQRDWYAF
jgi:hypothetical protein